MLDVICVFFHFSDSGSCLSSQIEHGLCAEAHSSRGSRCPLSTSYVCVVVVEKRQSIPKWKSCSPESSESWRFPFKLSKHESPQTTVPSAPHSIERWESPRSDAFTFSALLTSFPNVLYIAVKKESVSCQCDIFHHLIRNLHNELRRRDSENTPKESSSVENSSTRLVKFSRLRQFQRESSP